MMKKEKKKGYMFVLSELWFLSIFCFYFLLFYVVLFFFEKLFDIRKERKCICWI